MIFNISKKVGQTIMSKVSQFEIDEAILDNTPIEETESTSDDHAEFIAWKQRQAEEEDEEKFRLRRV